MKISPAFRISIGLVLLTLSILMMADLAGLAPDHNREILDKRKKVSESLAIEFSLAAQESHFDLIAKTLKAMVNRNEDIVSAGLRRVNGKLIAQAGNHAEQWNYFEEKNSSTTHVAVPIFQGEQKWGSVEIQFTPLTNTHFLGISFSPAAKLLLFVAFFGFAGYAFLMHRTLRYLDPSSIVPGRVQFALNALRSGVVLIDEQKNIVLANSSFSKAVISTPESLLGRTLDEFAWRDSNTGRKLTTFPWNETVKQGKASTDTRIRFNPAGKSFQTYIVNCTPILDANQKCRGALISFEDISSIQKTNEKLRNTLGDLEESRNRIEEQNKKLTILASRDSLTGCMNRRYFFEQFDKIFLATQEQGQTLACIMTDIDHFKNINDSHGHLFGDQVIKFVAEILDSESRSVDLICRYGGEEFCVLMPDICLEEARGIAKRLRFSIEKLASKRLDKDVCVTASFGISVSTADTENPLQLVGQADTALYSAKQQGRNQVITWSQELDKASERREKKPAKEAVTETVKTGDFIAHGDSDDGDKAIKPHDQNISQLQHRIYELETEVDQQSRELLLKTAYDTLTGLPNRVLFQDRMNQAIARAKREEHIVAVISLDIEAFKQVHDTLGNHIADELIRKVSGHLTDIFRNTDTIALLDQSNSRTAVSRINVDEFGILITDLESVEPITWVIKRIFDILAKRAEIDKNEISLNSHIGISLFPNDGTNAEALIKNASAARYHASKQPTGSKHQFYSSELNTSSTYQLKLESELSHAMKNDMLMLYYQPKVNINSGKIIGAEALLRWNHPSRGMVSPADFIPVAERSGLINELGDQVLRKACEQAKKWTSSISPDFCISVNLSSIQLRQKDLYKRILKVLEATEILPSQLEMEITESSAMNNLDASLDNVHQLQAAGIRVSLDDFGTGFSSLSQLCLLPVDTLKIDRSFIAELAVDSDNLSIVAAIIAMAHKLGMNVLAEGVETVPQLELLRKLKCDEIQGYLFSMPVPAEEFELLLSKPNSNPLKQIENSPGLSRETLVNS
ncbi:MAG: EAL domain-containing protein [Gammaproteobacteria bacterium]